MHADVRVFPTEDWLGASHKSARKVLPACQPKMADDSTSSAGERFNQPNCRPQVFTCGMGNGHSPT